MASITMSKSNATKSKPDPRRCLTLHQPWASLIVYGIKRAEGRVWNLCHKKEVQPGRLWIHSAAKEMTKEEQKSIEDMYTELFALDNVVPTFPKHYPKSCLLGCIDLKAVVSQETFQQLPLRPAVKGESSSPFVFLCSNPRKLIMPLQNKESDHKIWNLTKDVMNKALEQGLVEVNACDANFEEALIKYNNNTNTTTNGKSTSSSSTGETKKNAAPKKQKNQHPTQSIIYFYGHSQSNKYGAFSQFYACTFVDESNVTYSCAEQWMMASKAKVFNDMKTLSAIMNEQNPMKIKQLGRKVKQFNQATWDFLKYDIVVEGNRLKFSSQNVQLKELLLSTGTATLVEAAANDKVWGIGISVEDAKRGRKWNGTNLLGKALMEVRNEM